MTNLEFIDYVLEFYGHNGLYPIQATRDEVLRAIIDRLTDPALSIHFERDSIDREIIRDIIIQNRKGS